MPATVTGRVRTTWIDGCLVLYQEAKSNVLMAGCIQAMKGTGNRSHAKSKYKSFHRILEFNVLCYFGVPLVI